MALTPCVACGCIPGNETTLTWQQNVRRTLCDIVTAVEESSGGGGGITPEADPVVNLEAVTIAFGALTNAFAATGLLDAEEQARQIGVLNNTNQDVQLSYGGADPGPVVPVGQFRQIDYASNGRILVADDVYIKYLGGSAPTMGSVVLDGFY